MITRDWAWSRRRWAAVLLTCAGLVPIGVIAARYAQGNTLLSMSPERLGAAWSQGGESRFDVTLKSGAKLPSSRDAFRFELSGELRLHPLPGSGQERVAAVFVNPKVRVLGSAPGAETPSDAEAIRQTLMRPIVITVEQGRLVDAWYPARASAVAISLYRTVLGAMQLSEPDATRATAWSAEEYDSSGRYLATYQHNGPNVVVRKKSRYLALLSSGRAPTNPEQLLPRVAESTATLTLADGKLAGVQLREVIATQFEGNAAIEFENTLAVKMATGSTTPNVLDDFDEAAFAADALHLPPEQPPPRDPNLHANFDALRTEGWQFDGLLSELARLAEAPLVPSQTGVRPGQAQQADPKSSAGSAVQNRTRAFSALVAFLRSKPETIALTEAQIRSGNPATEMLIDGLGSAGTPAAQQSLVRLMQHEQLDRRLRLRAAIGLSHVEEPEPESVRVMLGLLDDPDIEDQALLGIGSMARRLRDRNQQQLEADIARRLRRVLDSAATNPQRIEALRAISNAGNELLLDAVRPYLTDADNAVRSAAVEGLRHMRDPSIDTLLADLLTRDPTAQVQMAVLQAAQTRGPSQLLTTALAKAMGTSEHDGVRHRSIELARTWKTQDPTLRKALELAARTDKDNDVREAAAAALK